MADNQKYNLEYLSQSIKINGYYLDREKILQKIEKAKENEEEDFILKIFYFLKEWWSDSEYIEVKTSGSTGAPKLMKAEKSKMMNSAVQSCKVLGLNDSMKALLCLPIDFIAGKMIIVRAMVCGMNVHAVRPSEYPLREVKDIHFAAFTPNQIQCSLKSKEETNKLSSIKTIIIGGAPIPHNVEQELKYFDNDIYATYGMTETLSHIALRKISGKDASEWFTPLQNVTISLSEKGTLNIDAPSVANNLIETNDLAEINNHQQFKIIGRIDNVINSGGVKIQIEKAEELLSESFDFNFMISSVADEKYGEIPIFIYEGEKQQESALEIVFKNVLPKHWTPKKYVLLAKLPMTHTGKKDRNGAKEILKELTI